MDSLQGVKTGAFGPRHPTSTTRRAWQGGAQYGPTPLTALCVHRICPHRGRSYCSRVWSETPGAIHPKGGSRVRRGPGTWQMQSSAIGGHQPCYVGSSVLVQAWCCRGEAGLGSDLNGRLLVHVIEPGAVLERRGHQMRIHSEGRPDSSGFERSISGETPVKSNGSGRLDNQPTCVRVRGWVDGCVDG